MTQKINHDDKGQYSKKIVKCLTTTRSKKELCIFARKIDKKSSSYCCLRSFGRSGNKFPAIKSISNTALDTTICLVAHFSKAVGTGDTRGNWPPTPYFDRMKTCYMKLPYSLPPQMFKPFVVLLQILAEIVVFCYQNCSDLLWEMVFCYQNCSDLLWEKIVLVIEKNFWNLRLKAENLH